MQINEVLKDKGPLSFPAQFFQFHFYSIVR